MEIDIRVRIGSYDECCSDEECDQAQDAEGSIADVNIIVVAFVLFLRGFLTSSRE